MQGQISSSSLYITCIRACDWMAETLAGPGGMLLKVKAERTPSVINKMKPSDMNKGCHEKREESNRVKAMEREREMHEAWRRRERRFSLCAAG